MFLNRYWPTLGPRAKDFFDGNNIKNLQDLPTSPEGERMTLWIYFQIQHFLSTRTHKANYSRPLTAFETLFDITSTRRHLISTLYGLFFQEYLANTDVASKAWEKELDIYLEEEDWEAVNALVHSGSACVSAQENGYKRRSRWYRTHSLLHKIYSSVSDRCWYCGVKEGTSHLWWSCPLLQPFWKSVHEHISNISTMLLDFTLAQ